MTVKRKKLVITKEFNPKSDLVLFEGDTREFLKRLPNDFFKLIVTSPPYNLGKEYEEKLGIDEYLAQQREIISECVRVLHPKGSVCWEVGNYVNNGEIIPIDVLLYPVFASLGVKLRNRVI